MDDLEIMAARDADDEGPACGTAEALTTLDIRYSVRGELRAHCSRHCCYRHIPGPRAVLPRNAVIEKSIIKDGRSMSSVPLVTIAGEIEALLAAGVLALG